MFEWGVKSAKKPSFYPKNPLNNQFYWHDEGRGTLFIRTSEWNIWSPVITHFLSEGEKKELYKFIQEEYPVYHTPTASREYVAKDLKDILKNRLSPESLELFCKYLAKTDPTETIERGG